MKENKYDNIDFFKKYSNFPRSVEGLNAAGEWHEFKKMLPDLRGKRVLDLGCGFGWHCIYAIEQGASSVIGIDISEKMLTEAKKKSKGKDITYIKRSIEDYEYPAASFDIIMSSLAFHYISSFDDICKKVWGSLVAKGDFVFSVEHPVFTAEGLQDWIYNDAGEPIYWPVDRYFSQGERSANFLGETIVKYHKTLTTYVNKLLESGFAITGLCEPMPTREMLESIPQMKDELRRPMMLIISARKI